MKKNSEKLKGRAADVSLPPLTIEGKRLLIKQTAARVGEKAFLKWLRVKNIPTLRYLMENVRKYKSGFFREMLQL